MLHDVICLSLQFLKSATNGDMQHILRCIISKSGEDVAAHHVPALTRDLTNHLSVSALRAQAEKRVFSGLTDREAEVMALLGAGMSNLEVSRQLGIAERTVRQHIESMQCKLGVRGRGRLVARAYGLDLLCRPSAETPIGQHVFFDQNMAL